MASSLYDLGSGCVVFVPPVGSTTGGCTSYRQVYISRDCSTTRCSSRGTPYVWVLVNAQPHGQHGQHGQRSVETLCMTTSSHLWADERSLPFGHKALGPGAREEERQKRRQRDVDGNDDDRFRHTVPWSVLLPHVRHTALIWCNAPR